MKQGLLLIALIVAACLPSESPSPPAALPSVSPAPTESPTASPTPAPQASAAVPFPDVSLIAAAATGELHLLRSGRWERLGQPCSSGLATYSSAITFLHLSADGRRAWFQCDSQAAAQAPRAFVYNVPARSLVELAGTTRLGLGPISPDGRFGVAAVEGDCPMPAPVCQTKRVLIDLETNARRDILPSDYWLSLEMRWTSLGLTYFLPECSNAGCPGPDKAGTYRWDDPAWTRISPHRLVDFAGAGRMLLERRRSLTDADAPVAVIERTGTNDRVLSRDGVTELALALDERGVTVFRVGDSQRTMGSYVRYEDGREIRATAGAFNQYFHARSGNWLITLGDRTSTGSSGSVLRAYSLDRHLAAAMVTNIPIVALAALGP